MELESIRTEIRKYKDKNKSTVFQSFFKSRKGEYAEGDKFLGIDVPTQRKIAGRYKDLSLADTILLLRSSYHEERLTALLILVANFKRGSEVEKEKIYRAYLANTKYVNNWDLVDLSAYHIVGEYLCGKDKKVLTKLAQSRALFERRIAVIATFYYIKKGEPKETLRLTRILLNDRHDLIHKAVGWMLREVGKRCSMGKLEKFLKSRYKKMPRTMLRYAIEKMPEVKRRKYLLGEI